jgi:hypothetical protein
MNSENPLKLIHLANFNSTNIGNGALISGLESTLEEDLPCPISWSREPWDDYTFGLVDFDQGFVDKVNASDGLIVGGAVTFNGREYNHRTGTRFELPLELWSKVTKPVVFYGLSYRHWPGQTYHHIDRLKMTIEKILASDHMLLAVRNDGTKKWLKALTGIDSKKIQEIPDQGVFVHASDGYYTELLDGAKNIIVSFNDEDAANRFDQRRSVQGVLNRSRDYVIDGLVSALERLADHFPINIILCPHYFDDYRMMSAFLERIRPRLAHQQMVSTGLCRVKDTNYFYGRYRRADLSISMRVHSMSPCIGLGTPMVAYTTQDRMVDFMQRVGLRDHSVDAFGKSAADALYDQARYALENGSAVRETFLRVRATLRESVRCFNCSLHDVLTASSS